MFLNTDHRPSDSPYIDQVWHSRSDGGGIMTSVASANADLVFWRHLDQVHVTMHGPETAVTRLPVPAGAVFFGITFSVGTVVAPLSAVGLVDRATELPSAGRRRRFSLAGSWWHVPDNESAEQFVDRLVRDGVLGRDPLVAEVADGGRTPTSARTVQRRFRSATGLTPSAVRQIGRARSAAIMLRDGHALADVVHRAGYFDGPHLRRSLARFVGLPPARLREPTPDDQLSLLYTT